MVQKDQEEQEQLALDQKARMAHLVKGIEEAGLSEVIAYAVTEVQPTKSAFSTSEEDVRPANKHTSAEDYRHHEKQEKMRMMRRE